MIQAIKSKSVAIYDNYRRLLENDDWERTLPNGGQCFHTKEFAFKIAIEVGNLQIIERMADEICLEESINGKFPLDIAIETKNLDIVHLIAEMAEKRKLPSWSLFHGFKTKFTKEIYEILNKECEPKTVPNKRRRKKF